MKDEKRNIKWGILGLGKIAHKFAMDIQLTENCELYAVASRTLKKAEIFSKEFSCYHAYGNYKSLAEDPEIDAIYIATPHTSHLKDALLCLEHGKAVLCEKPMGINSMDVNSMVALAENKSVLLMEALWTRFLPHYKFVVDQLQSGSLGEIYLIEADFGFKPLYDPQERLFNKELGGGSLLDIGIYPLFLALSILGEPDELEAEATFFETGVDSSVHMLLTYDEKIKADLRCSLLEETPTVATITCANGSIKINSRFHSPTSLEMTLNGQTQDYEFKSEGFGYKYEIEHFNQLLRDGKTESNLMSFDLSKCLIANIDVVKDKIGLEY